MNNIVVLPCSNYQKELIVFLKEKGNKIIGINPIENETTKLVDILIKKDIFDINEIYKEISHLNIKEVFTDQSDIAVLPSIELSKLLKVPHNKKKCTEKFSCNKSKMYKHLKSKGFNVLDFQIVTSFKQINLKFPLVLKPSDSANSRGIIKVNSQKELESSFNHSLKFSREKTIIAQKWSDSNFQITCEGICIDKKHQTIASSYKGPYLSTGITSFVRWPLKEKINKNLLKKIYELNDKIVHSTKIKCCLTHSEYIIENETIYINEIACRGGGFKISSILAPWVSGINLYEIIYDYKINFKPYIPKKPLNRSAIIKFYTNSLQKDIKNNKNIIEFNENFNSTDFIKNDNNPRKSYLLAIEKNKTKLDKIIKKIELCF